MRIITGIVCLLLPVLAQAQFTQQGGKLFGSGAGTQFPGSCQNTIGIAGGQGSNVAVSADGNTLITGANVDPPNHGAAWIFTRTNGVWSQQGAKLVGSNPQYSGGGSAVAISADGNTAMLGNNNENAVWFFTRSNGVWSQQGPKISGTNAAGSCPVEQLCALSAQGASVALSADGNTAIEGGPGDFNNGLHLAGAAWIFTRTNGVWTQQGDKLVGSGVEPFYPGTCGAEQGQAVGISADGNTAIVGGPSDGLTGTGAAWIFKRQNGVWSQQGSKLVGTGATGMFGAGQGNAGISGDGNTVVVGGSGDGNVNGNNATGASWVFTRSNGVWTQQGGKLVGTGSAGASRLGTAVGSQQGIARISGDGNTIVVGSLDDNNFAGAFWIFTRSNGVWT